MDFTRLDLDTVQAMIHNQAVIKGWNIKKEYMIKRAFVEMKEVEAAFNSGIESMECAKEIIDVCYFLFQALYDLDSQCSLNEAFSQKYNENWINKKKTIDDKGRSVRK